MEKKKFGRDSCEKIATTACPGALPGVQLADVLGEQVPGAAAPDQGDDPGALETMGGK